MESDPVYRQYRERRNRLYERLEQNHARVSEWIERHGDRWPALTDLAQLEALHLERQRLFDEFQKNEDQFIDQVLRRRRD